MKMQKKKQGCSHALNTRHLNQFLHKLPVVCLDTYETSLFSAAFTLAYYAVIRVGDFALSKGKSLDKIIQV